MSERSDNSRSNSNQSLTYADSGVDIDAGNALVNRIKPLIARTSRAGVMGNIGGFGGFFEVPVDRFKQPVMVSGADGVGTKLKLAIELGIHDTIGIDLVAMCVNDIIVCGAEPLWFLDYYATGKLDIDQATDVITGIVEGCQQSGAALLGGETAEMPGMYAEEDYDLAGFAVGIVEKSQIIDGSDICNGDTIIGLGSSGPHSNGYSLIRQLLDKQNVHRPFGDSTLGQTLLAPTRIYARTVAHVLEKHHIRGIAHITGGGITENIPRVLPDGTQACIDKSRWQLPEIFSWLQKQGNIADHELFKTFNCGIGMVMIVDTAIATAVMDTLNESGESSFIIGQVRGGENKPGVVYEPI